MHLNDSKYPLGSKKDRHCSIGKGYLGLEVFHSLVRDKRFLHIPMIIENPLRDEESQRDLILLRKLQNKKNKIKDIPLPEPLLFQFEP